MRLIAPELNRGGIFVRPVELPKRDDQAQSGVDKKLVEEPVDADVLMSIGAATQASPRH